MAHQLVPISRANLESYRDQWQRQNDATTCGEVRDHISNMCMELHVTISELPGPLRALFEHLRFYNIKEAARIETLLEATELSMEQVEG